MTAAAMNRLVRDLKQSLAAEQLTELPDAELLRRTVGGDAAAFETVVRRHGPAVLAAARAVLADETDVEDVFQATFLALWRSGRRIRKGTALGSWLFGVARRAALKALARAKRRRQIEGAKPETAGSEPSDLSWREACRVLHEEIDRLPEQYRAPIVLCHLEGRSRDEAAGELGWKLATLRGRLERGRDLLKRRLTRRGVALSAGLLAWLAGDAAESREISAALIGAVLRAPKELPAQVVALLPSVAPIVQKATLIAAALLLAGALVAGLAGGEQDKVPAGASPAVRPAEDSKPAAEKIVLKGRVVDPAGKPVPRAKIDAFRFNIDSKGRAVAGANGRFTLELAGGHSTHGEESVNLVAAAPGFAPVGVHLPPKSTDDLVVRLSEGTPLEGRVVTLEGQPVIGADVQIKTITLFAPGDLDKQLRVMRDQAARMPHGGPPWYYLSLTSRYGAFLADVISPAKTDANGRFRIANVGAGHLVEISVAGPTIQHVELLVRTQAGPPIKIDHASESQRFTVLSSPFEHVAKPARLLRGVVREKATGKPVAGANVSATNTTATAVTDAEGRYEVGGSPKSVSYRVTVRPPADKDLFVADREVGDTAGLDAMTVDVDLLSGIRVTGRVLDAKTGKPVLASVEYFPLPGNKALDPRRDASGTLHKGVGWRATRADYNSDSYSVVVAAGPGLLLVRADERRYLDACVDPAAILPNQPHDRSAWGDRNILHTPLTDGLLMLTQRDYRAIEPINPRPGTPAFAFDIELTPTTTVKARFLDPDGKPVARVWTHGLYAGTSEDPHLGPHAAAEFTITGVNPKRPREFYAYHAGRNLAGEFTITGTETNLVEFRLQKASTLTGRLVDRDGKPLDRHIIHAYRTVRIGANGQRYSSPYFSPENFVTDAEGKFIVAGLLPQFEHMLYAFSPRTSSGSNAVSGLLSSLKPGETRDVGTLTLRRER